MKYFISILFIGLSCITYAQSPKNTGMPVTLYYPDEQGKKTEILFAKGYTQLDPDEVEVTLNPNNYDPSIVIDKGKTGQWSFYDENGKLYMGGTFNNDLQTGKWHFYYPDGSVKEEITYDDHGIKNGIDKIYFENGQLLLDGTFRNDLPKGLWKCFDYFGLPTLTVNYDQGNFTSYYNNGKVNQVIQFSYTTDGRLLLSKYDSYYDNGYPHLSGTFDSKSPIVIDTTKDGLFSAKLSGIWKTYWETGELATLNDFDKNTEEVIHTEYTNNYPYKNENGAYGKGNKVLTEINYTKNKDGIWASIRGIDGLEVKSNREIRNQDGQILKVAKSYVDIFSVETPFAMQINKGAFNRTGTWEYWSKNNVLISKIEYSRFTNSPNGKAEFYYPDGKTKSVGSYNTNGKLNGLWKYYYANGNVSEERNYNNGVINGLDVDYFENGKIKDKANYSNGKIASTLELYHPNGKVLGKEFYVDGKFSYYDDFFDEDGRSTYQNGNGYLVSYYENGQVSARINLSNAKRHSICTWYYENGNLKEQSNYIEGQVSGDYKLYFQSGIMMEKGNKVNGKVEGLVTYYHPNGKILGTVKFANNTLLRPEDFFDEFGKPILTQGSGTFINYNTLGTVSYKANYTNYCRDGLSEWFYDNGQLSQAALYKYSDTDKPFGLRWEILEVNDKNGNPLDKGTLKNGNGTWISYDEDGKASVNEYVNGRLK